MHRPPVTSGYGRDGEPPPHDDAPPAGAAGTMLVLAAQLTMLSTAAVSRSVPLDRMLQVHTVSGFSSGATLAINHGVAFSASVRDIGVLGGSPYGCNILPNGGSGDYTTCSYWTANRSRSAEWLSHCGTYLRARAAHGAVDALEHMANKPVYLFSGTRDSMVWQRTMRAVEQQFRGLGANVYSRFDLAAEHGWIVDNVTCNRPNVPTLDTSGVASTLACCGAHPDLYGTCVLPNVSASDEKQRAAGPRQQVVPRYQRTAVVEHARQVSASLVPLRMAIVRLAWPQRRWMGLRGGFHRSTTATMTCLGTCLHFWARTAGPTR